MRLLVNHMPGKIYLNIIRCKREPRFECELQVEYDANIENCPSYTKAEFNSRGNLSLQLNYHISWCYSVQ